MSLDSVVSLTSFSIDHDGMESYHYNVYKKDDDIRKKPLYMGEIGIDGTPIWCTCTGFSILKKCYHGKKAFEIIEVKIC